MSPGASQAEKAAAFRALHEGEPFLIPNPWDAGSARVLEALGFKALATTSSGFAFTPGRLDGGATLDNVAAHTRLLAAATGVPLSVDLENGYGPDPEDAAAAILRVAEAGAVGGSIEDWDPSGRLYSLEHAAGAIAGAGPLAGGAPPAGAGAGRLARWATGAARSRTTARSRMPRRRAGGR